MDEKAVRQEIEADLQAATVHKVIYLEGQTDLRPFFALLGVPAPVDGIHQGVLVKLRAKDRGRRAVAGIVEIAIKFNYPGVYGVIDGDGRSFSELVSQFDDPYPGPLFSWKAYCIENLLAKTGWPQSWKIPPNWAEVFKDYGPYVALNRIHMELRKRLESLGLAHLTKPFPDNSLKTSKQVIEALARDKHLIQEFDVEDRFRRELQIFETAVDENLDEAHSLLNGKWLVEHFAFVRMPELRSHDRCRWEWCAHALTVGGLPEVRDLWRRITGNEP